MAQLTSVLLWAIGFLWAFWGIYVLVMGAAIPASLQWKIMDGSFVTMTQSLAGRVFQAVAVLLFSRRSHPGSWSEWSHVEVVLPDGRLLDQPFTIIK